MEKASPFLFGVFLCLNAQNVERSLRQSTLYPLDLKTLWVDFWLCPKCKTAYEPKKLKPIAHVV
jgi:hypothetical protein